MSRADPARAATGERGFALVTALWALALLAIMAGAMTLTTHTEARLARTHRQAAELRAAADAAIEIVLLRLASQTPGSRPPLDGTPFVVSFAGHDVRITTQDETGKIDVNFAPGQLIARALVSAGMDGPAADEMADRVMDWRDRNPGKRLNGAKADDYMAAGYAYGPRNGFFATADELRLTLGLRPGVFEGLKSSLTAYAQNATINPNVAPAPVLAMLPDMDPDRVEAILTDRLTKANDLQAGIAVGRTIAIDADADGPENIHSRRHAIVCPTGGMANPVLIYSFR